MPIGTRHGAIGAHPLIGTEGKAMEHFGHIPDLSSPPSQPQPTELDKSWVLSRIEMIMAGYRKADYHSPEAFMMQVAMNLMKYPKDIIEYVSAPTTGIQTRSQWPPSLAEIVNACIAEQTHREKIARYTAMGPALPRLPKPPKGSGVTGDGGPGTTYDATAFATAFEKHGRPTGVFETGREHPYGK